MKDRGNSNWTAVDQLMDAYRSLMNIMLMPCTRFLFPSLLPPQQHLPPSSLVASASELLEVIEIGIVQFGLPLMSAHGPGSQVLVELLASEKKLTISERVHCREWLNRMRDYFHEQKVVDHMQKICNGIKNENRCTVGENSFSRESSPFFFGVGASLLPSPAKPVISGIKGGSVECNEKDKQILAVLSPLILFSSTYQLEVVSKKYFDGRLRSYELKPLVLLQQTALKQYVKEWNSSSVKEECEVGIPDEIKSLRKDVVDQLADKHLVLVHISQLFHEFHNLRVPNEEGSSGKPHVHQVQQTALVSHGFVEAIIKKMVQHTFHSLLPFSTASELWTRVQNRVTRLAQHRWSRAVEAELCQEVWERGGVPPHSLSTAPKVTRRQIEHYWSVYHFILLPELQFDTAELCCMAYYVPELIALHRRFEKNPSGYQEALWELASTIHTSHFTSCSLFEESRGGPIRRPRSLRAIHALLHRGRKTLVRLHHQLEMDARGTRYLFHLYGGPRHHQDYITPSNGLNLLRNFYDLSAFSLTSDIGRSVSRITALHEVRPSRVEPDDTYSAYNASNRNSVASRVELIMMVLACGNISPLDTHEEEMKMPFFARYISEAAVRDQQEAQNVSLRLYALETFLPIKGASPGTGNSGVSPVLSRTSFTNDPKWNDDKLLQVVHECCERIRGHNGPSTSSLSSLPSWLLFWHGRKAKELVQEESTMPKDAIVRELLRSIKDPVVSGLGMLHVHFAWYGKEIPVELSEALMEHVKFIIYHSVPNRERDAAISYNNPFCSLTSFFTPQEDQYYAQKPLLDLVVLWKMFSFFNVWKSIHFSRRNVFWYLLSPSLSDIDSLPCKTKSKRGKEKKSRDPE